MAKVIAAVFVAGLSVIAGGCVGGGGEPDTMQVEKTCYMNACEARISDCENRASALCQDCYTLCAGASFSGCSCDSVCESHCTYSCYGDEEETCVNDGYEFEPGPRDAAIAESCADYAARVQACGGEADPSLCETFAHVERPEAADAYACLADLECDEDSAGCVLGTSTLGREACGVVEGICNTACNEEWAAFVDEEGAWVRPDVANALRVCFDETDCDALDECMTSWLETVATSPEAE